MNDPGAQLTLQQGKTLVAIAAESWRFLKPFSRLLSNGNASNGARFVSQYPYCFKRLKEDREQAGLRPVNVEWRPYGRRCGYPLPMTSEAS